MPANHTTPATFAAPLREIHAATGEDARPGEFEAVASTFNTVVEGVFYDQVLKPGCFSRSLGERGYPPVVWSHDWDTPPIGETLSAKETAEGLHVRGRLFVAEDEHSPRAREVWTAMRASQGDGRPALQEFSIGFAIRDAEWEVHDGDEVLAIADVDLHEYGPCLVGRNRSRLIAVHSAGHSADADPVLRRFGRPPSTPSTDDPATAGRLLALRAARPVHR